MKTDVRVYPESAAMARAAARFFVEKAAEATSARGIFRVALAGGSTPKRAYAALGSSELATLVEWRRVDVFWGDERCVPPNHPDSNYRMAREALLSSVPIPSGNIHGIRTDLPPGDAAKHYTSVLMDVFRLSESELPRFDLVLLGMGVDGHTASLFPDDDLASQAGRLVAASTKKRQGHHRLTLTLPVINNSANVAFLVSGSKKAATLSAVLGRLRSAGRGPRLPAELVRPIDGELVWFVDEAAAQF